MKLMDFGEQPLKRIRTEDKDNKNGDEDQDDSSSTGELPLANKQTLIRLSTKQPSQQQSMNTYLSLKFPSRKT
jgi:hypothetical protein